MLRFSTLRIVSHFGSIKQFKMPDLGEKIKEATIKEWHVKVGDKVEEFQAVADVATDKMFTQIPSSYNGIIHKIFHQVEESCQVGELFLEIEVEGNDSVGTTVPDKPVTPTQSTDAQTLTPQSMGGVILATPVVRGLAKEKGIDLSKIKGTGQDGRILAVDLEFKQIVEPKIEPKSTEVVAKVNVVIKSVEKTSKAAIEEIKMTDFQKGMQKTMTASNQIPTLYLKEEFDLTALSIIREQMKQQLGIPITFMSLFIKAFSLALLKYPIVNSTYDVSTPFEFKQHQNHNISIALDSPKGLVVPNIKGCQSLSILDIHEELNRLRKLGEKGQLSQKDLQDGTICLSNIGTIGGTYTGPLILPPQVCIVGLGRLLVEPRYDENMQIVPKKLMNMSFGCDHRVLDGATVTRFSNQWRTYLEKPHQMLIHLK